MKFKVKKIEELLDEYFIQINNQKQFLTYLRVMYDLPDRADWKNDIYWSVWTAYGHTIMVSKKVWNIVKGNKHFKGIKVVPKTKPAKYKSMGQIHKAVYGY